MTPDPAAWTWRRIGWLGRRKNWRKNGSDISGFWTSTLPLTAILTTPWTTLSTTGASVGTSPGSGMPATAVTGVPSRPLQTVRMQQVVRYAAKRECRGQRWLVIITLSPKDAPGTSVV